MNDLQKRTAQAIVNIFETGRVAGDYGAVTLLQGDSGHLTYGRSQTTLGSGNLFLLIKAYCERLDAGFANELRPFLADLSARNADLDRNMQLREILRQAGGDPAMRDEQDRFFSAHYFTPAVNAAQAQGVISPLGQAVIYDSFIQGGFGKVTPLVGTTIGPGGVDEREWIEKYVAARKSWLSGLKPPLPKTIYRMEAFESLIGGGAWDLPLNLTVRGVVISPESLDDSTVVIRASAVDPSDPPPPPILHLTSPYMRGEEVRKVQEALNTNGFANSRDGLFGPFTEALVKRFQDSKGLRADGVVGPAVRTALGL
jgi:chitosanase